MKRLALKVLLKFLSSYTCWNLVKKANCYHLFFLTNDEAGNVGKGEVLRLGGGGGGVASSSRQNKAKKRGSKVGRKKEENVASSKWKEEKCEKESFIFSPIFENVEESIKVGIGGKYGCGDKNALGSIIDDNSKRSSFDSLCWDDFLPYKKDDDDDSYATIENSTDVDSKESTPLIFDEGEGLEMEIDDASDELCVKVEGDKLLDDMVQLRKDIEHLKDFGNRNETPENDESISLEESNLHNIADSDDEESLRQTLEIMTLEIKKEIDEKQKDIGKDHGCEENGKKTEHVMRNFFEKIVSGKIDTDKENAEVSTTEETMQCVEEGTNLASTDLTKQSLFTDNKTLSDFTVDAKDMSSMGDLSEDLTEFEVAPTDTVNPKDEPDENHLTDLQNMSICTADHANRSELPLNYKYVTDVCVDTVDENYEALHSYDLDTINEKEQLLNPLDKPEIIVNQQAQLLHSINTDDENNESVDLVNPEHVSDLNMDENNESVHLLDPRDPAFNKDGNNESVNSVDPTTIISFSTLSHIDESVQDAIIPALPFELEEHLDCPAGTKDIPVAVKNNEAFQSDGEFNSVLPLEKYMTDLPVEIKDNLIYSAESEYMSVLPSDVKNNLDLPIDSKDESKLLEYSDEIVSIKPPCVNNQSGGEFVGHIDFDSNDKQSVSEEMEALPDEMKNEESICSTNTSKSNLLNCHEQNVNEKNEAKNGQDQTKKKGSNVSRKRRSKKNCTKKGMSADDRQGHQTMKNDIIEERTTDASDGVNTIMSPAEKIVSKDVLRELLEVKEKQGQDPILDTMISIMNVASTHLSLPAPPNNGVQFRDLFDFEVNLSESRAVFEKLVMNELSNNDITVQELFPWSNSSTYNKLRGCLIA